MQIEKDKVVTFHYRLSEADELLESTNDDEPLAYLHGHGGIIPALEQAMTGRQVGDRFSVTLAPEQAYGPRRERPPQRVPIKHLLTKGKLKPGQVVAVNTREGPREAVIVKVGKFNVDVDTNHPLAGKILTFEIDIQDVREATPEELSHGHAHGVGGHRH